MSDVKDQLESAAAQVLQSAIDAATKGAEFLKDQMPDVLRQLIMWKTFDYGFCVIFWAAAAYGFFRVTKMVWKWAHEDASGLELLSCFPGIGIFGCALAAAAEIENLLQITIAPKVWLLEYAAHLVKH